jgi:hypothetical protein
MGGGTSSEDKVVGKSSFFSLPSKFSLWNFFAQFGALPAHCTSSVAVVARYCCAVVSGQSVCHLLGNEKLVVVVFSVQSQPGPCSFSNL